MTNNLVLRDVREDDLAIFFEQQRDADACFMAAFTARNPADHAAFTAHWRRNLANPTGIVKTIVVENHVVGHVLSYKEADVPEVSYWIGKTYWSQGIATRALAEFLARVNLTRPIRARAATDNIGSRRVLEKCGFAVIGTERGYANARGTEIEEVILELSASTETG